MNSKINIIRLLFVAFGLVLSISNINATHIVGGDITYKYLGKDTFEITFTLRRDCNLGSPEAQFDDPALLSIYDGRTGRVRIDLGKNGQVNVPYSDDDTLNTYISSDCGFEGSQVCVHETKYVTKIRLPYNTRGYYIVYQRCCRNSSLNNIVDPLEAGSTYSVRIDRVPEAETNSSPVFNTWPDVYICKDRPLVFDHGATDADGDSLVYKLWNPLLGLTKEVPQLAQPFAVVPDFVPVEFTPGYGLDNLLGGQPLQVDPLTGQITANPNMVGQFLVGIEVQEYRKGVYLGSVYRDFQYNVRVCALPPVANFTAPSTACDGLTITFDNTSTTATRYEWNFNYPSTDPAFMSTEATPTFIFPQSGIYDVQLVAIRGSDQCRTNVIKKVTVFDIEYKADFDFKTTVCSNGDSLTIQLLDKTTISDPQFSTQKYRWTLTQGTSTSIFEGPSPVVRISATQDIILSLEVEADNLCTSSITKNINIGDVVLKPDFDISDVSCKDEETVTLTLTDKSTFRGSNDNISSRVWSIITDDGNTFSSTEKTITFTTERTGFSAALTVAGNGCVDSISKIYTTQDFFPTVTIATSLVECQDSNTLLMFKPVFSGMSALVSVTDLIWTVNGEIINADSISYLVMANDNVVLTLDVELSNGCNIKLTRSFNGNAFRPKGAVAVDQIECTTDDFVTLKARYTGTIGYTSLVWTVGVESALQTITENEAVFTIPKDSAYSVTVLATYAKSCETFVSQSFAGKQFASIDFITNPLELCAGEKRNIVLNSNSNFTYTWTPTDGLDLTVPSNPILTAVVDQVYNVTVSDGVCSVTKQLQVKVVDSLILGIIGNTNTCDGKVSLTTSGNIGVGSFQWSFNPDFSNVLSTADTFTFQMSQDTQMVYLNFLSDFCNVKPAIATVINRAPSVVKGDQNIFCTGDRFTYQLVNANPNEPFNVVWSADSHIVSDLNSGNINIVTTNDDVMPIKLYFKLFNTFGCETNDSIVFNPSVRPTIDWTFNNKECGKTEICFNISGDPGSDILWDFGVSNIGSDTSSALAPCYTYPEFGNYTVTLTSLQSVCGFMSVSRQIDANVGLDLVAQSDIVLCTNDTATISVKSGLPELVIMWFDAQGNIVANGPLYTFVPKQDEVLVLTATDAGGCVYRDTVNVKLNKNFPELSAEGPFTVCLGDTAILKAFVGDVTQYDITWDQSQYIIGALNIANPQLGIGGSEPDSINLTFRIVNSQGCSISGSAPIKIQTSPTADFTFTREDCNSKQICFDSKLTPGYELFWDFGVLNTGTDTSSASTPCFTFPDFGTYTVKLTSLQSFCMFTPVTKQINVNAGLDLVGQNDVVLCTNDTATISVKSGLPELVIMWSDAQGNIVANGPLYTFVPKQDQVLVLTATDAGGCVYRDTVNVKLNKNFPELSAEGPFTVCLGDTAILKAFVGDVTQYDITWDQSQYIIGALNIANPQLGIGGSEPDSINLTFRIVNSQGCSISGSAPIEIQTSPTADFTFTREDCNSKQICFDSKLTPGYELIWDFGVLNTGTDTSSASTPCFTFPDFGTYTVKLTSLQSFCMFTPVTKQINVNAGLDLVGQSDVLLCTTDTATISVKSGLPDLVIMWSDALGNIVANGPVYKFVPQQDQILILTASDPGGCSYKDTVNVKIDRNFPELSAEGPFTVCLGDTGILKAFTVDVTQYDITWDQSQFIIGDLKIANPQLGIGGSGTDSIELTFRVVNSQGCSNTGKAPIVIQTFPTADFSFNLDDCKSNKVCFTTGVPMGYDIKWDFGNSNADNDTSLNNEVCYTYPGAGTYPIILSPNGDFCKFPSVEKSLTLFELGEIVGQEIVNVCVRDSFKTAVLENVPDFDIQWINEAGEVVSSGRTLNYRVNGSQILTIVATDPNGCTYIDSISLVGINESPQLEYLDQFQVCLGDTVQFPLVNANSNHNVTILWEENSHIIGPRDVLNPMIGIEPDEMDPFSIAFEATTQFGCILRDTIDFTLGTPNIVSIDHIARDCENYEVCFSVVGQFTGFAAWDFGDPNKPSGNVIGKEACFTYSGPGTYEIKLRNIAAFCEFPMVSKTITLRDGLVIFEEDSMTVCKGENILLAAPGSVNGLKYEWLDLQGNSLGLNRAINITVNDPTSVRLMVVDGNGCVYEDTLGLLPFVPQYVINMPQVYCLDVEAQVSVVFTGSNAEDYDFVWSPAECIISGANSSNPVIDVTKNKAVFVTITSKEFGCLAKDTINVVPFSFNITAVASPDTIIDLFKEVEISVLNPQNGWTYLWSNGATTATQTVAPEENTTYTVTVTDANGCTAESQVSIRVNPPNCEEDVFIPTAFSPNQDGVNDILYVRSNYIDKMELIIINRWGQEVFTSTSVDNGWDGKFKGKELSPDAFAFYLTATCVDGVTITRRGNISLLR